MKKFFENPVGGGYSSPAIEVIELNVEGSICQASFNGAIDSAEEDDWGTLGF